jgi:uncharacterized protein (TIGR03066 family)
MRLMRLCSAAALALAIAACGSPTSNKPSGGGGGGGGGGDGKLADQIIGKWEMSKKETVKNPVSKKDETVEQKIVMEFTKDGKVSMSMEGKQGDLVIGPLKGEGTYKVVSETEVETKIKNPLTMMEETEKHKVTIKGDEMTAIDPKGMEQKFKRMK